MQERAEGDYTSSHVSGGSRFVPWVISKKERAQLPIGTLRKLRKLECEVGQPAESGLCMAPQRQPSLFGRACWVLGGSTHTQAETPSRPGRHEGLWSRGCGATACACESLRPAWHLGHAGRARAQEAAW